MSKQIMHFAAFTLAEILITLSIIGVIASMTIPSLVQDIQEAQYKTAWKKAYVDLDQATKRIMMDNAGTLKDYLKATRSLYPLYKKYLNYTKDCDYYGCLYSTTSPAFNYKRPSGNLETVSYFDDGQLILNNGIFFAIENCAQCNTPVILWVDVNGYIKGPNIVGKDVFGAKVNNNGIKPLGSQGDGYENTCNSSSTGWGCSAEYLYK